MIFNIDEKDLVREKLTADEYILLVCIGNGVLPYYQSTATIDSLVERNFIEQSLENPLGYKLSNRGADVVGLPGEKEKYWEQFKSMYPKIDGSRRLHADADKCRRMYLRYIDRHTEEVHQQILQGLQNEQKLRYQAELNRKFFPAQKSMPAWLNQKHWLTYMEDSSPMENTSSLDMI